MTRLPRGWRAAVSQNAALLLGRRVQWGARYWELPRSARRSLIQYMGINGEAWDFLKVPISQQDWREADAEVERRHRANEPWYRHRYGFALIDTKEVMAGVMRHAELRDEFGTAGKWVRWYTMAIGSYPHPAWDQRWPCILASHDDGPDMDELFQDGWHRLNRYYRRGDRTIPVLWYIEKGRKR